MEIITQKFKKLLRIKAVGFVLLGFAFCYSAQAKSGLHTNQAKSMFTVETNRIWLNVTNAQGAFSQTLYGYRTNATNGFDYGLDGAYMNDGIIALSSLMGSVRYAIQFEGLPFSVNDVVPLSFAATFAGTYTFSIDHMDGFFTDDALIVYLYDTVTGTSTDLKTGNYTFTSTAGTFDSRFQMRYAMNSANSLGLADHQLTKDNLEIYQENTMLTIQSEESLLQYVALYNLNGQLICENKNIHSNKITLTNSNPINQPIIIKAISEDGSTVSKKWLYF
jgi:hypothetical protein